jgi:hypothetical protein
VLSGPHNDRGGKPFYFVVMDKDSREDAMIFHTDEIEAEV